MHLTPKKPCNAVFHATVPEIIGFYTFYIRGNMKCPLRG
jgi:hypothetical protein